MGCTVRVRVLRLWVAVFVVSAFVTGCGRGVSVNPTGEPSTIVTRPPVSTTTPTSTTEHARGDFAALTVAAVGDWYADDPGEGRFVEDAEQTRDAIIEASPSLLLVLGDLTYDGNSPEPFFEFLEPLEATVPAFPTYGNHDGIVEGEVTRPGFYSELRRHFSLSDEWYSFDAGPIHFISINSEYPEGSVEFEQQFLDIKEDLAGAYSDESVKAIIPFFHRAMANPISPDGPDRTLQEFVYPLLDSYSTKIPLALQAHHHIYTRTHAIAYSEERNPERCKDDEVATMCEALHRVVDFGTGNNPPVYGPDGIVFVTVGTGGAYPTGLTPDADYVAVRLKPVSTVKHDPEAGTFGYLYLSIDADLEYVEGQYRANNGQVLDWFFIELP